MSTTQLTTLGLTCAIAWGGCSVDDRTLTVREDPDPPPAGSLVIATFEDRTAQPEDPRFNLFQFYAYNTSERVLTSPIASPGASSNFALGLNWKVVDSRNDIPDYPGAGVRTTVKGSVDLSAYSRIVFKLKYAAAPAGADFGDTSTCYPVTVLKVTIGCGEYSPGFRKTVLMPEEWTVATLAFVDFREVDSVTPTETTVAQCLSVADGIDFQAQTNLSDGECASGALLLDDISLRLPLPTAAGTDGSAAD